MSAVFALRRGVQLLEQLADYCPSAGLPDELRAAMLEHSRDVERIAANVATAGDVDTWLLAVGALVVARHDGRVVLNTTDIAKFVSRSANQCVQTRSIETPDGPALEITVGPPS